MQAHPGLDLRLEVELDVAERVQDLVELLFVRPCKLGNIVLDFLLVLLREALA